MRTVLSSKNTDRLGRYYTHRQIGQLLVQRMDLLQPRGVLDLGAGAGSLALAAVNRWKETALFTVDVDNQASQSLRKHLSALGQQHRHIHLCRDALALDQEDILRQGFGALDAGVCNPPFLIPKWRKGFGEILEDAGFSGALPALSTVDAAALFLAQNLRLLNPGAALAIILPDSLIAAQKYLKFRKLLLANYHVKEVVSLPRNAFHGTDAKAHVLVLSTQGTTDLSVRVLALADDHSLTKAVHVPPELAAQRMDFSFHASHLRKYARPQLNEVPLSDLLVDARRGSFTSADRRKLNSFVLHTTDIHECDHGKWLSFPRHKALARNSSIRGVTAGPGDIVVARVGRNLERKIIGVGAGEVLLTDCLIRLKVKQGEETRVLKALASPKGAEWLSAQTYGVAAKQLSKADLLSFPVL